MSESLRYRSLYISDLSSDVTDVSLLNAFSRFGPITSARIVRNRKTRQSLGFGYVNFMAAADARNALMDMNFSEINGKQIRVTVSQSNPNLRKGNKSNVFVKNLEKSVDNKRLYDTFKKFGIILSCKVAQQVNGESKGFAFIQFDSEKSAIDAIVAMNGRQLDGRVLFCSKFLPKNERQKYIQNTTQVKSYANIFVKNLSQEFNDNILKQLFTSFGSVIAVQVFHKDSKHFGFVCFEDSIEANNAVIALNGKTLPNGWPIHVSRAFKMVHKKKNILAKTMTQKENDGRDIYVKYLDQLTDSQKLTEMFAPFGQITDALVFQTCPLPAVSLSFDRFGFISFSSPESAQKAVQHMNNTVIQNKALFVKIANSLNERNNYLSKPKPLSSQWNQSVGQPSLHLFN